MSEDDPNPYKPTHLDLFTPPEYKPKPEPEWATYIPHRGGYSTTTTETRNGSWKIHSTKGAARGSMTHMKGYARILYHLEEINGTKTWVEVERHEGR